VVGAAAVAAGTAVVAAAAAVVAEAATSQRLRVSQPLTSQFPSDPGWAACQRSWP